MNLEELRKKHEEVKKVVDGGGFEFWTPKEGTNLVRIMPPMDESKQFYLELFYHFKVGSGDHNIVCPSKVNGSPCPICDYSRQLIESGEKDLVSEGYSLKAKAQYFYSIIDLNDAAKGVQVYRSGITIFKEFLSYFVDPDWGDLTDPINGYDITIERTGTGLSTKYNVRAKKNASPIDDASWIDSIKDLSVMAKIHPVEDIEAMLGGTYSKEAAANRLTKAAPAPTPVAAAPAIAPAPSAPATPAPVATPAATSSDDAMEKKRQDIRDKLAKYKQKAK